MNQILNDLRSFMVPRIRTGFESPHEIAEQASQFANETLGRDDLQPTIKRLLRELIDKYQKVQLEWEPSTDCDRLDQAFATLEQLGIVARQNFSCCNNCGFAEIWDEIDEAEKHRVVEGYVFFHFQSTERAFEIGQLLMAFGCIKEDSVSLKNVVDTIVTELQRVGLNASWKGTIGHPIVVNGIVWRKRLSKNAIGLDECAVRRIALSSESGGEGNLDIFSGNVAYLIPMRLCS